MRKCPECGCDIQANANKCPLCDCILYSENQEQNKERTGFSKTGIAYIMFIVALIMVILGIFRITSSDYNFYMEHYESCMDGYKDSKYSERTSGLLFSGTYSMIADEYEEMANEDMDIIWKYRIQSIACFPVAISFVIVGIIIVKGKGDTYEKRT